MSETAEVQRSNASPANACLALEGKTLKGQKRGILWKVIEKIERKLGATGGTFSVGYIVEDDNGNHAFMKATDIGLLTQAAVGNALENISRASHEQTFERQILDVCHGNNMDKIVRCFDYGELPTTHNNIQDIVFFLVFEKAEGDVRTQISESKRQDLTWSLHALHNLSIAIKQLHSADIAHNDIKPSNLLVFDEYIQKLADMGRATSGSISGPFDIFPCPGQLSYAAPEQLYTYYHANGAREIPLNYRRASDLYLLGSMLYFFITGEMLTPMVQTFLRVEHHPPNWNGTFFDVLPYWRNAHGSALIVFERALEKDSQGSLTETSSDLMAAFKQLCDPDPALRGHPSNRQNSISQYSVERYVSLFDLLRNRTQIRS